MLILLNMFYPTLWINKPVTMWIDTHHIHWTYKYVNIPHFTDQSASGSIKFHIHFSNWYVTDRLRNPGVSTQLKFKPLHTDDDEVRLSNSSIVRPHSRTSETFNFTIPLKDIFGFCEDYKKVMINVKQEIVLVRSQTDTNAYEDIDGDKGISVKLTSVQWHIPFVTVNDSARLFFLNVLQKSIPLRMAYRTQHLYEYPNVPHATDTFTWPVRLSTMTEKPRFVIVAFQTKRHDQLKANASEFDNCNVKRIRLDLGTETYPYTPLDINWTTKKISVLYDNFMSLRKSYYGTDTTSCAVTAATYLAKYPFWVFDCSRQSETVTQGAVDVRLEIQASANFPASTTAFCLIISDCLVEYIPYSGLVRQIT